MRLTAMEFMRRFLQHVLPKGFHKVRYFGFLHPTNKRTLDCNCCYGRGTVTGRQCWSRQLRPGPKS